LADAVFVCAHGAGGHKDDRQMVAAAEALAAAGFEVVRFNFPYREQGRKLPDPMPVLKDSIASKAENFRGSKKLILGGRSMGGRAASMLAADGFPCDGLLLLAYPLHPAGKPDKLRDAHLPQIRVPVLCFNGTRDTLCTRSLMDTATSQLKNWQMHWLEGAAHTFRPRDYSEIAQLSRAWNAEL
jgi:uncharacterized protein